MNANLFSVADEIETVEVGRPHVVILGAGASLAAFPRGDKNGRMLPLIKNVIATLGLTSVLKEHSIEPPYEDFEGIYSELSADSKRTGLCKSIELAILDYFSALELPETPSLYDHLLLSLRKKDVIATFNWDPFLWQAAARNHRFAAPPTILFLHGNVAIGYCPICKTVSTRHQKCAHCAGGLRASPLLYPVKRKNYQNDDVIAAHWRTLQRALKHAYAVTFFGYGAPRTDVEAVDLLKNAWGKTEVRSMEETEIIDIRQEEELLSTWSPFIHSHHFQIHGTFYESLLAKHPRRSCEALWARLMECQFLEGSSFPKDADWDDLYKWLEPRINNEST